MRMGKSARVRTIVGCFQSQGQTKDVKDINATRLALGEDAHRFDTKVIPINLTTRCRLHDVGLKR